MTLRVSHIAEAGLRVKDLPWIVAFYQEVLGLEIVRAFPKYVFLKVGELNSGLGRGGHPQLLVGTLDDRSAQTRPVFAERSAADASEESVRVLLLAMDAALVGAIVWHSQSRGARAARGGAPFWAALRH